MSDETKDLKEKNFAHGDVEALKKMLEQYRSESEPMEIPYGVGTLAETDLFSFEIPEGYTCQQDIEGLEAACYFEDFQTTPLQITVKSEPLVLISPDEHREELRASFSQTRGMVISDVEVGGMPTLRCDIPTLGGQQMFFPLYHETELFSLRINFVGKITNSDEILERILTSFHFKEFQPRFRSEAVDSVINVFEKNCNTFRERFQIAKGKLTTAQQVQELCQNYGNAMFGCFRVLAAEMEKICQWQVAKEDMERLVALGEAICKDLDFSVDFRDETFSVALSGNARTMMEAWKR